MQNTSFLDRASREELTAIVSSMGSSGGITDVTIMVQFRNSLNRLRSGSCKQHSHWHSNTWCLNHVMTNIIILHTQITMLFTRNRTYNILDTHNSRTGAIACVAHLKAMIQHICRGSNCKDHEEEDEQASLPVVGTDVLG